MRSSINHLLFISLFSAVFVALFTSCSEFLDVKPDEKLAVPSKLKDLEALLNHNTHNNQRFPGEIEESADNHFFTDEVFNSLSSITGEYSQNVYLWKDKNLFADDGYPHAWFTTYLGVYTANAVLEGLKAIEQTSANRDQFNRIKGRALFLRALRYYYAAQIWAPVYDKASSQADLGLPLRTHTDFNEPTVRASVEDTYLLIVNDLKQAAQLLPALETEAKTIPNKAAAYGMLARVSLAMRNYDDAGKYADTCLLYHNTLINYNELNEDMPFPIERFNPEVIFDAVFTSIPLNPNRASINPDLYNSYADNDLRKTLFFVQNMDGTHRFRGSYVGSLNGFAGIATDEVYLIRAESSARNGAIEKSLSDLNTLLQRCWPIDDSYPPLTLSEPSAILDTITSERRKQLLYRGARWTDLRRLNKEGANIILTRVVNGQTYELLPNSSRYVLPIPEGVIRLSGIPQNP